MLCRFYRIPERNGQTDRQICYILAHDKNGKWSTIDIIAGPTATFVPSDAHGYSQNCRFSQISCVILITALRYIHFKYCTIRLYAKLYPDPCVIASLILQLDFLKSNCNETIYKNLTNATLTNLPRNLYATYISSYRIRKHSLLPK